MNRPVRFETKRNGEKLEHLNIGFELKEVKESDADFFVFEGIASSFGNLDTYNDTIAPGAFKQSIKDHTPTILWQHNRQEPIGMPIELREVKEGLFVKARLPRADSLVRDRVIPQVSIGSINSMSIGFYTKKSEMDEDTGIRTLKEIDLREISLVTMPADRHALISDFKSAIDIPSLLEMLDLDDEAKESLVDSIKRLTQPGFVVEEILGMDRRTLEQELRESGFCSNAGAVVIASKFEQSESVHDEPENKDALLGDASKQIDAFFLSQAVARIDKHLG